MSRDLPLTDLFNALVKTLHTSLTAGLAPDDLTRAVQVAVQQYGDTLYQRWRAGDPDVHAVGLPDPEDPHA